MRLKTPSKKLKWSDLKAGMVITAYDFFHFFIGRVASFSESNQSITVTGIYEEVEDVWNLDCEGDDYLSIDYLPIREVKPNDWVPATKETIRLGAILRYLNGSRNDFYKVTSFNPESYRGLTAHANYDNSEVALYTHWRCGYIKRYAARMMTQLGNWIRPKPRRFKCSSCGKRTANFPQGICKPCNNLAF